MHSRTPTHADADLEAKFELFLFTKSNLHLAQVNKYYALSEARICWRIAIDLVDYVAIHYDTRCAQIIY